MEPHFKRGSRMEDIVFKPKYKTSFWFFMGLAALFALALLTVAVMVLLAVGKQQRPMHTDEVVMSVSFFAVFALLLLCVLNTVIRKVTIGEEGMAVTTLLGMVRRRPFSPVAYYEDGCFIINGYVLANNFMSNIKELDAAFKKISMKSKFKYIRERGVLTSRSRAPMIALLTLACVGGIVLSQLIGSVERWILILFIDATVLFWFAMTFNKLPRAGKRLWKQILALI
jgi:hypothetical protein